MMIKMTYHGRFEHLSGDDLGALKHVSARAGSEALLAMQLAELAFLVADLARNAAARTRRVGGDVAQVG